MSKIACDNCNEIFLIDSLIYIQQSRALTITPHGLIRICEECFNNKKLDYNINTRNFTCYSCRYQYKNTECHYLGKLSLCKKCNGMDLSLDFYKMVYDHNTYMENLNNYFNNHYTYDDLITIDSKSISK